MVGIALVNPFRPTAGAEPPTLIGRDRVIEDFSDGLVEGVGAPARLMRVTGPRGSGKTVLLTELGDYARSQGWKVIDVTAQGNFIDAILHELKKERLQGHIDLEANLGPVKAKAGVASGDEETFRDVCTRAVSKLTEKGAGLLVTVDEIQDADPDEVREIAATVQHLIREKQNIAFIFAGLTVGVLDLINGKALTFLRRAKAEELAAIPEHEVAEAMQSTIDGAGMHISGELLEKMAQATKGYAYLIQLVGYYVFAVARRHAQSSLEVSEQDVEAGIGEALNVFAESVQELAVGSVSERAMEYLLALARHDGNVSTAEIAQDLGIDASSLTSVRRLLIKKQVIEAPSRGVVRFAIPYMREFLLNNEEQLMARY